MRRNLRLLVFFAAREALLHNAIKDSPRFGDEQVKVLPELFSFRCIILLVVLLTFERNADPVKHLGAFHHKGIASFADGGPGVFMCPVGDPLKGAIWADNIVYEILLANIFDGFACESCE